MLDTSERGAYDADHERFRGTVRKLFARELYPNLDQFEEEGIVSKDFWRACGDNGLLCPTVP